MAAYALRSAPQEPSQTELFELADTHTVALPSFLSLARPACLSSRFGEYTREYIIRNEDWCVTPAIITAVLFVYRYPSADSTYTSR